MGMMLQQFEKTWEFVGEKKHSAMSLLYEWCGAVAWLVTPIVQDNTAAAVCA